MVRALRVCVDMRVSFDVSPLRPFYARRASLCTKLMTVPATAGGRAGNCVTGPGIKCARLNDKSNRCVCVRVRSCALLPPRNVRKQGAKKTDPIKQAVWWQ